MFELRRSHGLLGEDHGQWYDAATSMIAATGFTRDEKRSKNMENPDTWGLAERVVDAAIQQAEQMQSEGILGLSLARQITDALRENGLLIEP